MFGKFEMTIERKLHGYKRNSKISAKNFIVRRAPLKLRGVVARGHRPHRLALLYYALRNLVLGSSEQFLGAQNSGSDAVA